MRISQVYIRKGVALLWMGDYTGCEKSFISALTDIDYDKALDADERSAVEEDLNRIRSAASACDKKNEIDKIFRKTVTEDDVADAKLVEKYTEVFLIEGKENAVVCANRGY